TARELAIFSPLLGPAPRRCLTLESALARRKLAGGTARANGERRLAQLAAEGLARAPRGGRAARRSTSSARTAPRPRMRRRAATTRRQGERRAAARGRG